MIEIIFNCYIEYNDCKLNEEYFSGIKFIM